MREAILAGSVEVSVEGRRRTVMLVEGGESVEREERIAVPSSPAPRTRMCWGGGMVVGWRGVGSACVLVLASGDGCLIRGQK